MISSLSERRIRVRSSSPDWRSPTSLLRGRENSRSCWVRCKPGVTFAEINPRVHTMFALVGSMDERNFHLRVLMHIAHLGRRVGVRKAMVRSP